MRDALKQTGTDTETRIDYENDWKRHTDYPKKLWYWVLMAMFIDHFALNSSCENLGISEKSGPGHPEAWAALKPGTS